MICAIVGHSISKIKDVIFSLVLLFWNCHHVLRLELVCTHPGEPLVILAFAEKVFCPCLGSQALRGVEGDSQEFVIRRDAQEAWTSADIELHHRASIPALVGLGHGTHGTLVRDYLFTNPY